MLNSNRLPAACLVLSGAAGLICEVVWIRSAALQFGSTVYATSTVLAVFFLGLALGSRYFGDRSANTSRPLATYGRLELALAALALLSLPALGWVEGVYDALLRRPGLLANSPGLLRVALVSLVLLPPTFLMGGSVPLVLRSIVRHEREIGRWTGMLYGLNTLGGAIGCVLAGFVLIPAVGMTRAVAIAAALNAIAGAAALAARAPAPATSERPASPGARPVIARAAFPWLEVLVFLTGFTALAQEVLWTRFLALVVRNTVYTYTLALAVILAGILAGSFLVALVADRVRSRARLFGTLQVTTGLLTLGLFLLPAQAWAGLRGDAFALFLLMLVPSALSGAAFPLAVRMTVTDPALAGRGLGRVTSLNTLGGIAGALAAGFAMLPRMGLQAGMEITTAIGILAGFGAWALLPPARPRPGLVAAMALAALAWFAIPRFTGTRVPADFLASGAQLVAAREGLESNLAVLRRDGILSLEIDRWWQGESRRTHQVMAAHLPMLLHPSPRRVLVIGIGAGQTPSRFLMHGIERLDCVDIEPAVFDLVREHFRGAWMSDPRVRLIATDGRGFLLHGTAKWDLVSIEIGQIFRPGAGAFYTEEFYRRARARLAPGGLVSQFVPISFLDTDSFRGIVRTFREVFPNATLWYNTAELLMIGGLDGPVSFDPARLRAALGDSTLARDLRYAYWGGSPFHLDHPGTLLGGFLCGPAGLEALAQGGRLDRDDHPRLDYAVAGVTESDLNEVRNVPLLRRHLDPAATILAGTAEPEVLAEAGRVRESNLADIAADAQLRRVEAARLAGDTPGILALASRALAENPENLDAQRITGDALILLGRASEAEPRLRRVVEERPDDALARRGLGIALHQARRFGEAVEQYRAAIALGADAADLRNNLGAALAEGGDLPAAAVEFEQALRLRPGDPDATRNLGQVRAALSGASGATR